MALRTLLAVVSAAAFLVGAAAQDGGSRAAGRASVPAPPNIVVVFADDLGYGDLGSYGATGYSTPRLDRMAAEGVRFTSFYAAQAVCSASRAALLTGAYPNRIGITGALGPHAPVGLHHEEQTVAELLKARGYATAIFGKWHLGDAPEFLPARHGFDEYYGLPYSNDMWPRHPERPRDYPPLPLIEGTQVVQRDPDQHLLTGEYTERAVRFIERHAGGAFFLYLAHSMPHVPLHAGARFRGTTARGPYGDVVSEIDWSVGRVLDTLARLDLDARTLVVFTSDNGPWLSYGNHAGSAGPLREGKGTTFEGGVRVPAIARWPGRIPAGRSVDALATTMDLVPTIAGVAGAPLPERPIDGKDIWPLLAGASASSPHDAFYYYWGRELQGVRSGRWKLHLPHGYATLADGPGADGRPSRYTTSRMGLALYDLDSDPGERRDVFNAHPDVVAELQALAERARGDLGDSLTDRAGANVRPAGRVNR